VGLSLIWGYVSIKRLRTPALHHGPKTMYCSHLKGEGRGPGTEWVSLNAAILKLGVATLFRVAKNFLRVAKVYTTGFFRSLYLGLIVVVAF
jgi:hypothetical protein